MRENYERYEKSRIDRKLKEILTKTGTNINTIKNIETCLNHEKIDEKRPRFRFDNESLNIKDTLNSKFKIKELKKINNSIIHNVKSKIFSKTNSKNCLDSKKINLLENDFNNLDDSIKIILNIYISKNKKYKFEFYSNQDPVILTQRFLLQNELLDLTIFKKNQVFEQINKEITRYSNNSKLYLSQIES